jgi:3'(2'), 5'-bisphosphate nucleotidase
MDFSMFGAYQREAQATLTALYEGTLASLRLRSSISGFTKADGSVVTSSDFVTQAHVLSAIVAAFPSDVIVAEESLAGDLDDALLSQIDASLPPTLNIRELFSHCRTTVPSAVDRWWTIDPIDGTEGYVRANGHYVVAVALIVDGRSVFSGVGWPTAVSELSGHPRDEPLYYLAAAGCGAFVTNCVDPFAPLRVPPAASARDIAPMTKGTESEVKSILATLHMKYTPVIMYSMAKAIVLMVSGGPLYFRPPWKGGEYAWDIAPISLFVEESGGIGTLSDGTEIRFTKNGIVRGSEIGILFSARGEEFHRAVIAIIQNKLGPRA